MIKDNQQHFNRLHVVLDGLVVIVSYALAWWLKLSGIFTNDHVGVLSFEFYMKALIFIVPLYLLLYYAFNLYTPKRAQGRIRAKFRPTGIRDIRSAGKHTSTAF